MMNNDLISREALKQVMSRVKWINEADGEYVRLLIETAPPVDPVHAAGGCYCRECEYWSMDGQLGDGSCDHPRGLGDVAQLGDFCSYGEQEEGDV